MPDSKPPSESSDNYDITNMPFGDLEYLTKSLTASENQGSVSGIVIYCLKLKNLMGYATSYVIVFAI